MSDISWDTVSECFVQAFPSLSRRYQELLDDWETDVPGQTIVFDDIVSPYLLDLLRSPDSNDDQLKAMFSFFEAMAIHEDRHVRDLLSVTICEQIVNAGQNMYDVAYPLMGPATRHMLDEIAPHFGVTVNR